VTQNAVRNEEAAVDTDHEDDSAKRDDEGDPEPVAPENADEAGFFGGSGGPASIIYGDSDEEADEHGDRLSRGPDESL